MFARITTTQGNPDDIEDGIAQYRQAVSEVRKIAGNKGAFLLIDRSSGKGIATTLWGSEQAMVDSRGQANQLRQRIAEEAAEEIQSVEEFEVAVWEPEA